MFCQDPIEMVKKRCQMKKTDDSKQLRKEYEERLKVIPPKKIKSGFLACFQVILVLPTTTVSGAEMKWHRSGIPQTQWASLKG